MKITIAHHAGFCFGVRRAIDITFKVRQNDPGKRIYTLGQIIHNPQVIDALTKRGIGIVHDIGSEVEARRHRHRTGPWHFTG